MTRTLLITKEQCGTELGGITAKQVLHLVRKSGLPCVYLSRRSIRFELNAVRKWAENRPVLGKTEKQRIAEKARRDKAKAKKGDITVETTT
jgi:hypothetical protein